MKHFFYIFTLFLLSNPLLFGQGPGGVSTGLTAWYKADAGVAIAGGIISRWTNQAANPNLTDLTQNGGPSTLITDMPRPFNFNPYVQFNNGCMSKEISTTIDEVVPTDAGSMIGVGTQDDQLIILTAWDPSAPCVDWCCTGIRWSGSQFGGPALNWTGGTLNVDRANIWGFRASINGAPQQENTYNGFKNSGSQLNIRSYAGEYRFTIGSFIGYFYGEGRIAEAVCHNRQLNADEFARVESYLAVKYGVTLGNNTNPVDYYSSNGTVIWTGSNLYQNNITGIGRDDNSILLQKQSRSVNIPGLVSVYQDNTMGAFPAMNAANNASFAADQSFLLFGDNLADTTLSQCSADHSYARMPRTWKVQATGAVGPVTLALDASGVSSRITALLVADDPDFTTNLEYIPIINNGTQLYAAYSFSGNQYFTFGTQPTVIEASICQGEFYDFQGRYIGTAGTYDTLIDNNTPCDSLVTLHLTVKPLPDPDIGAPKTVSFCPGDPVELKLVHPDASTTYQWLLDGAIVPGETAPQLTTVIPGPYRMAADLDGCRDTSAQLLLVASPLPEARIHDEPAPVCALDTLILAADEGDGYLYRWSPEKPFRAFSFAEGSKVKGQFDKTTTVVLTVYNGYGCSDTDTTLVQVIPCCVMFVPTAFSPNADGLNDYFLPRLAPGQVLVSLQVYNRYGNQVYNHTDGQKGWNGKYTGGGEADPGIYMYYMQYTCTDGKLLQQKGDIHLIR